jgi:mutator protein MutT
MKREFSAGGIVYKQEDNRKVWLIRRPAPAEDYRGNLGWSFPKGWIDEGETTEQAAVREVREEGGVEAEVRRKLPSIKIFFTDNKGEKVMKFITYFIMEWKKDIPEGWGWETAEAKWVDFNGAIELLIHNNEKKLLEEANDEH